MRLRSWWSRRCESRHPTYGFRCVKRRKHDRWHIDNWGNWWKDAV